MTAFEPWVVGDTHPNVGSRSAISAVFDADIRVLSATRDVTEIVPVKVVFESVIGILALVRVCKSYCSFCFLHSLISDTTRTG